MLKSEAKERVEKVFSDLFGADTLERMRSADKAFFTPEEARDQPAANELLDSLDQVEFVMTIEAEFGVEIKDPDAEKLISVESAVNYVAERLDPTAR